MTDIVVDAMQDYIGEEDVVSRVAIGEGIKALFEEIKKSSTYNPVHINNFGTFKTKKRKARVIQNKMTNNQPCYIPERLGITFSPAKDYKSRVSAPKV